MAESRKRSSQFERLTQKQRQVLDLLILHRTSKQIARELNISPHTVDQRIASARKIFAVETRKELASAYQDNSWIYEKPVYQSSHMAISVASPDAGNGSDEAPSSAVPASGSIRRTLLLDEAAEVRVVPGVFEGPHGILFRLLTIGLLTILLFMILIGGMTAYGQLSDVLR